MRILVAGASGCIGQRLVPMLVKRGHTVAGTSRTADKGDRLRALGAEPLLLDALNAEEVMEAVGEFSPDVIVHQLTALAGELNLRKFDESFAATNRLRTIGTDNLLAAAAAAKVSRFVAQSYGGWPSERTGSRIKTEADPLDPRPPGNSSETLAAIRYLERAVTRAAAIEGVILRYGALYGPGNAIGVGGEMLEMIHRRRLPIVGGGDGIWSFVHIDDAAQAAAVAAEGGPQGTFNIVDDEPAPVNVWLPYLAEVMHAKPPMRLPAWLARPMLGEQGVSMMTQVRGLSNAKARAELGWEPLYASWRQGFRDGLG